MVNAFSATFMWFTLAWAFTSIRDRGISTGEFDFIITAAWFFLVTYGAILYTVDAVADAVVRAFKREELL